MLTTNIFMRSIYKNLEAMHFTTGFASNLDSILERFEIRKNRF